MYNNSIGTSKTLVSPDSTSSKVLLNNNTNLGPRPRCRSVDLQGSASSNYGLRPELPPLPTNPNNSNPNKFSSIAKSAGKKLAKKLQYIRRFSKTSLDNFEVLSSSFGTNSGSSVSLGNRSTTPGPGNYNASQLSVAASDRREPVMKRSISRPSIPPPEPPKVNNSQPTIPPISIYNGAESNFDDDDDDDFDDSDFYDSDSELIRNFVAAVQPIYSMDEEPLYQYYTYGISLQVSVCAHGRKTDSYFTQKFAEFLNYWDFGYLIA